MPPPSTPFHRRARRFLAAAPLLTACGGPDVATPRPEPPALDPGRIAVAEGAEAADFPSPVRFRGSAGAAPPGAVVRATPLDTTNPVVATTAAPDGSFRISIPVADGQELRLEGVVNGRRLPPVDVRFAEPALVQVRRPACVVLEPGFVLDFGSGALSELTLRNTCAGSIEIQNPRARLDLPDFTLATTLPISVASDESATLSFRHASASAGPVEEVFFVDVVADGAATRYPLTLVAGE